MKKVVQVSGEKNNSRIYRIPDINIFFCFSDNDFLEGDDWCDRTNRVRERHEKYRLKYTMIHSRTICEYVYRRPSQNCKEIYKNILI